MGMYTEIYVNVDFKPNLPQEILGVLKAMCGDSSHGYSLDGHPDRWSRLFYDGSYYTPNTSVRNLTYIENGSHFSLLGKGDSKNYEGEIEVFFEFIKPWVDGEQGDFIGYYRYESDQQPTLVYL